MHQTISQRRAILEGLRQRCSLSTAEFYEKVNRPNPAPLHRFNVIPAGNNQFGVVERSNGMVHQVCTGHSAACKLAQLLETQPAPQQLEAQPPIQHRPNFAVLMLRWTAIFCTVFLLFAFFGAQP